VRVCYHRGHAPMGLDARLLARVRHWRPGGYLQHVSKDPWGNDYQYTSPGQHTKDYDLFTLGADGQPGGEGNDADIGNWNMTD